MSCGQEECTGDSSGKSSTAPVRGMESAMKRGKMDLNLRPYTGLTQVNCILCYNILTKWRISRIIAVSGAFAGEIAPLVF